MKYIAWTCHVCGRERPDAAISVRKRPLIYQGKYVGTQNIRYCNDRAECIEGSETHDIIKFSEEK